MQRSHHPIPSQTIHAIGNLSIGFMYLLWVAIGAAATAGLLKPYGFTAFDLGFLSPATFNYTLGVALLIMRFMALGKYSHKPGMGAIRINQESLEMARFIIVPILLVNLLAVSFFLPWWHMPLYYWITGVWIAASGLVFFDNILGFYAYHVEKQTKLLVYFALLLLIAGYAQSNVWWGGYLHFLPVAYLYFAVRK